MGGPQESAFVTSTHTEEQFESGDATLLRHSILKATTVLMDFLWFMEF